MELTAISFENYKAFHKRGTIEVRPLTILIGRNNSGKSVIARLPMLIARALSDRAESPLDLEFDGLDFGASFLDIIHGRTPHGAVGIGATFSTKKNRNVEFWAKIQHFDEYRLQIVTSFELRMEKEQTIRLTWAGEDPLEDENKYHLEETGQTCKASFRGLFPSMIQSVDENRQQSTTIRKIEDTLKRVREDISKGIKNNTYLGPFRKEPERTYRFPGGHTQDIGFSGAKAPELLGSDFLRRKGKVLDAVGEWFAKHLGGWTLDLSQQGDSFALILKNPDNPSLEINVTDVGTGIAQVLPIVVQRQFETIIGRARNIEIIEQPELHLHPAAHGDLADLYVEAVNKPGIRFLVETHSENFLLRIRRRVAEGKINPNKVIIYWINNERGSVSYVQPIHIETEGELDMWPSGVFSEDFEEVRAIRSVRKGSDK